jgi:polyisoprenoid-binding protein YceI
MSKRTIVAAVAAWGLLVGAAWAAGLKFSNETSKIEFVGTKKGGKHDGGFRQFTGTIDMPGADFTQATIRVEIQTGSIYTDTGKLTNHLKSPDFFDVRSHPKATFTSTSIKPSSAAGATHEITGNLTLHGVTKAITIPAKVKSDANGVAIEATFTIQREDFAMTYGKGQVHNDVTVKLVVKVVK